MHGMIAMGRKKPGPKPKDGDRYPSGKLKPEGKQDKGWSPTAIRRAMDNAHVLAKAPILASELGRMLMRGEITSREAAAGFAYGSAIGRLERIVHGAPRRHCKGQASSSQSNSSAWLLRSTEGIRIFTALTSLRCSLRLARFAIWIAPEMGRTR